MFGLLDMFKGFGGALGEGMDYFGNNISNAMGQMQDSMGMGDPLANMKANSDFFNQLPNNNPMQPPVAQDRHVAAMNPVMSPNPSMVNGNPMMQSADNASLIDPNLTGRGALAETWNGGEPGVDWSKLSKGLGQVSVPQQPTPQAPPMPRAQMASGGGIQSPGQAQLAQMMGFQRQLPPWMQGMYMGGR